LPVPDFRTLEKFPEELPAVLQKSCVFRVREDALTT
jgi:hypothetical protein